MKQRTGETNRQFWTSWQIKGCLDCHWSLRYGSADFSQFVQVLGVISWWFVILWYRLLCILSCAVAAWLRPASWMLTSYPCLTTKDLQEPRWSSICKYSKPASRKVYNRYWVKVLFERGKTANNKDSSSSLYLVWKGQLGQHHFSSELSVLHRLSLNKSCLPLDYLSCLANTGKKSSTFCPGLKLLPYLKQVYWHVPFI